MPRNVEIKARIHDMDAMTRRVETLAGPCVEQLTQEDIFFNVPNGRLKLRTFADGRGELIHYDRENSLQPRESRYVCSPTTDPKSLNQALSNALGVRAVVRKTRMLYVLGQTRIHLDQVVGLGNFLELEVVLKPEEEVAHGVSVAKDLMLQLGVTETDLIADAYVDLT